MSKSNEGSTEISPILFGVGTVLLPTAATKAGKWYRGIAKAAVGFMARWHRDEVEHHWLRHAIKNAKKMGEKEKGGGRGGRGAGAAVLIPLSMKTENNWQIVYQGTKVTTTH